LVLPGHSIGAYPASDVEPVDITMAVSDQPCRRAMILPKQINGLNRSWTSVSNRNIGA
jgi:hypothetical protein